MNDRGWINETDAALLDIIAGLPGTDAARLAQSMLDVRRGIARPPRQGYSEEDHEQWLLEN